MAYSFEVETIKANMLAEVCKTWNFHKYEIVCECVGKGGIAMMLKITTDHVTDRFLSIASAPNALCLKNDHLDTFSSYQNDCIEEGQEVPEFGVFWDNDEDFQDSYQCYEQNCTEMLKDVTI